MRTIVAVLVALAVAPPLARAGEQPIELKDAPGKAVVEGNCGSCHSLDYIKTNSPFPDAKLWEAEVGKMIKAFGAPIEEADARTIAAYLAKNYGK